MNQTAFLKRAASITWHKRELWAVGFVGTAVLYTPSPPPFGSAPSMV